MRAQRAGRAARLGRLERVRRVSEALPTILLKAEGVEDHRVKRLSDADQFTREFVSKSRMLSGQGCVKTRQHHLLKFLEWSCVSVATIRQAWQTPKKGVA